MKRISFITGMVVISVASGLLYLNTTRDEKKPLQDTHSVVKRDEKELDVKYGNGDPKAPSSILSNVSEPQKSRLKEQQLEQDEPLTTDVFSSTSRDGNGQSRIKVQLLDANKNAQTVTTGDIHKQPTSLLNYGFKRTKDVYSGIDVIEYVDGGKVDFDFHVTPEGNISDIEMRFSEASTVTMDSEGNLLITAYNGTTHYVSRPRAWQENDGQRQVLQSSYVVDGNLVSIDVPNYRSDKTLVID
ncbi:hypothetical protein BZA03_10920 [Alteromonas sp. I10]|uniref:DUF7948 domain-containing protein n=1 Tax=Alteromonas TaxID=226 RepID=UPI000D753109|nr:MULTISPECIES: hypothetical protein [Alteromonas]MCZ4240085.1 hypothetical protein [Alteromonas macleodii]PXW71094.1 hypothetical protein BZA03_10920 [Alteromonas sp. I10]|tara:strand:+ start:1606 stop:2334 length:729 start_codon:yes stop_codon:yes gene_type:complete